MLVSLAIPAYMQFALFTSLIQNASWGGPGNNLYNYDYSTVVCVPLWLHFSMVMKRLSPFFPLILPPSPLPSLPSAATQDAQVHSTSVKGFFTFVQRHMEWWYIHYMYSGFLATCSCMYTVHRRGRPSQHTLCPHWMLASLPGSPSREPKRKGGYFISYCMEGNSVLWLGMLNTLFWGESIMTA